MLRSLKLFLIAALAVVLYFHWAEGYEKIQREEKNISFFTYAREDSLMRWDEAKRFMKELPALIQDVIESDDKIRRGSINKLADGLEIYNAEHERYPEKIGEIIGDYIDPKTKILEEKGFSYASTEDGQHFKLSIPLKNGELYTVER